MCHPVWLCSRKYGTVWYHPASSKLWYLTAFSFVNFQGKLTGTSCDSLHVWSQLVRLAVCLALGAHFASTGGSKHTKEFIPQGIHRPGGSRRSLARERNLHSLVQGLLDRSRTNVQTHVGTTLLQAGGHKCPRCSRERFPYRVNRVLGLLVPYLASVWYVQKLSPRKPLDWSLNPVLLPHEQSIYKDLMFQQKNLFSRVTNITRLLPGPIA
jgi:hypothetical protein